MRHKTRKRDLVVLGLLIALGSPLFGAVESPPAVSPGHAARSVSIEARCATFSWGSVAGTVERYELKVRDEAGNVTTLSPHNFSLLDGPSEPMAWSYYSENASGQINVDMLRTVRLVEQLSGERLVYAEDPDGSPIDPPGKPEASVPAEIEALKLELARIKEVLGLD